MTSDTLGGGAIKYHVEVPQEGVSEELLLERIGNLFKVCSLPEFAESFSIYDLIDADIVDQNKIQFRCVVTSSGWKAGRAHYENA